MLLWLAYLTSPVPSKSKSAFRIVWFSRPCSIPSAVWSERTLQILYLALPLPLIIIGRRTSDTEPQLRQLADLLTKYISCSRFCSFSKAASELVNSSFISHFESDSSTITKHRNRNEGGSIQTLDRKQRQDKKITAR